MAAIELTSPIAAARSKRTVRSVVGSALAPVAADWPLISCALAHGACAYILLLSVDRNAGDVWIYGPKLPILLGMFCFFFFFGYLLRALFFVRPASLFEHFRTDFGAKYLRWDRWISGLVATACIGLSLSAFTAVKSAIPEVTEYRWDMTFYELDRWLHFGRNPWEYLHPLLGTSDATLTLSRIYHLWFFILYGVFFWQAFSLKRPQVRLRFLVSFVLVWALMGNGMAIALASAGPCFFEQFTGNGLPYGELMRHLHSVHEATPMQAIINQEMLWEAYVDRTVDLGTGISAAPSIHVAMVTLLAFLGWQINRICGAVLTAYAFCIFIGSVYLGWHYAVDGYISVVCVALIWYAVGWAMRRRSQP